MANMRALLLGAVACALAACAAQVAVPPVPAQPSGGIAPVPGRYAALVQSGGWRLQGGAKGAACSIWSFDTDLNGPYDVAMRDALGRALEKVDFVSETLTPQRLRELGYDAQVVLYQGGAKSDFNVRQQPFSATAQGDVSLSLTLAVIDQRGLAYQHNVTGKGGGQQAVFVCSRAAEAIGRAARDAIGSVVRDSIQYARAALLDRRRGATK